MPGERVHRENEEGITLMRLCTRIRIDEKDEIRFLDVSFVGEDHHPDPEESLLGGRILHLPGNAIRIEENEGK